MSRSWGTRSGTVLASAARGSKLLGARRLYAGMIAGESAQARLDAIAAAARDGVVALMCFEASQEACHRYVVLQELQHRLELASAGRAEG